MIIFTKDFMSKKTWDGPSTSIINFNYKKETIINSIYSDEKNYFKKFNKNNIIFIRGFNGFISKLNLIYKKLKKERIIEFHCVYDLYGCLYPLFLLLMLDYKNKYICIYPRGMINENILVKKKVIRIIYLSLIKFISKKMKIIFMATSIYEKEQLIKFYGKNLLVEIKPNITNFRFKNFKSVKKNRKNLKILFFSNITWKKNFSFFYEIINNLNFSCEINIVGSIFINENSFYKMLNNLKRKHKVKYLGHIENKKIHKIIQKNHLLFLPTYDENFGHVIVENFFSSRPCILSSNTPWNDNIFHNAGFSIPLSEKQTFKNALSYFYYLEQKNYDIVCKNSKKYINYKIFNKNF